MLDQLQSEGDASAEDITLAMEDQAVLSSGACGFGLGDNCSFRECGHYLLRLAKDTKDAGFRLSTTTSTQSITRISPHIRIKYAGFFCAPSLSPGLP